MHPSLSDLDERWFFGLSHRALRYRVDKQVDAPDATVTTIRGTLTQVVAGERTLDDAIESGDLTLDGDADALRTIIDPALVAMSRTDFSVGDNAETARMC